LLDEPRVSIHCQTAAHYINYTTMTRMKEATASGKKRGIDQVLNEANVANQTNVVKEEENGSDTITENVMSQETETKTEVYN